MGIQGLLPQLKSIMVPIHIKDLEGCNVAVDTYSWLHKGALSCSRELCKGLPTSRHIEYCMHRVNLLRHFGIKPILVFDGGLLPMKSEQENKRSRVRKENFARAVEHESDGNSAAAYECYQKAVDISPLVACELIQVLKLENVQYIVAPYEADAQMTFLAIRNQVEAVITEDSDLIPFGCPRIIFKMDKFGQGVEYRYSMLQKNKELSFEGFTRQMLLEMCILSGCDYLQSLPGMGLKRAHAIIKRFRSYDKVLKHLRYSGVSVPSFYEESFKKAILTFQFQRVYDPINEDIVHLSDIPDDIADDLDFLGPSMPKHIAQGIAKGNLDPFTKMPFQEENLSADLAIERSSQLKTFNSESGKKKIDLPVQKNLLTKYFCFASLEAKRKFKAPRTSPTSTNQSTLDSYPVSLQEYGTSDVTACRTNSSEASIVNSEILCDDPSANNSIHDSIATKILGFAEPPSHDTVGMKSRSPEHTILRQPSQPIHKPCLGLHKEREHKNEHTLPRQPSQPIRMSVQDMVETQKQTEEVTRKVIVRSPYFQPKPVEKNDWDQKQDCLVKADVVIENNMKSESALCKDRVKNKVLKRKSSRNDFVQSENVQPSHVLPASPPLDKGNCDHNGDRASTESIPEEEKFGAKISHLDHYSEIAEKSMERFVSVMSSFRFSSSGSRASGLRAPLRDVRNTCNNRSTNLDFGQYAFVPNNQKTRKIGHRG